MFFLNIDPHSFKVTEVKSRADIIKGQNYTNPILGKMNGLINAPMVGASGALFGILWLWLPFPNTLLYIFRYTNKSQIFCYIYGAMELFLG